MSAFEIIVCNENDEDSRLECESYLIITGKGQEEFSCATYFESEENMKKLTASCMAMVSAMLVRSGRPEDYIRKFWLEVISYATEAEQVKRHESIQ